MIDNGLQTYKNEEMNVIKSEHTPKETELNNGRSLYDEAINKNEKMIVLKSEFTHTESNNALMMVIQTCNKDQKVKANNYLLKSRYLKNLTIYKNS